jgi:hypothetical protein
MESIGTIFGIIIAIIVIVSWVKSLNPTGNSSLQSILNRGLANVLGEQNNFDDSSEVKIYDENGNVINFQNNTVANNNTQDVIIYDEDGNVMSANSPPVPVYENKKAPETKVSQEYGSEEDDAHANIYHDFIRSNGDSAIVIQEILGKPAALRNN